MNPEVRRSQLAQSLPRHVKLLSRRLDGYHFVERIRISGGWTVQLAVGGCEHLGYTVTITGPWLSANTSSADLVAIARQVLPKLP